MKSHIALDRTKFWPTAPTFLWKVSVLLLVFHSIMLPTAALDCSSFTCPAGYVTKTGTPSSRPCSTDGCGIRICCDQLAAWTTLGTGLVTPAVDGAMVAFNNQLWYLGGLAADGSSLNHVQTSPDGVTWTRLYPTTGFTGRYSLGYAVHNSKIYLLGGCASSGYTNVVDCSDAPGVSWTSTYPPWSAQVNLAAVSYNSKLWMIGGNYIYNFDGSTWTYVSFNTDLADNGVAVVFRNQMWFYGGENYNANIYASTDGEFWTTVATNGTRPPARNSHMARVVDDRFFVFGGFKFPSTTYILNDCWTVSWSATDGLTWRQEGNLPAYVRTHHAAVLDGRIIYAGGYAGRMMV